MKARKLPQDGIFLDVVENMQEIIWSKIASGVKSFIPAEKTLLSEQGQSS